MADKKNETALSDSVRSRTGRHASVWASHKNLNELLPQWAAQVKRAYPKNVSVAEWYLECSILGERLLQGSVEIDAEKRGGRPVLKGTGFTAAQALIELADSRGVGEVAENFALSEKAIIDMLHGLSLLLSKPFVK